MIFLLSMFDLFSSTNIYQSILKIKAHLLEKQNDLFWGEILLKLMSLCLKHE